MRAFLVLLIVASSSARAEVVVLSQQQITEWKAVFGQVETRDRVPARARLGGTVTSLGVTEGDRVESGERVAVVEDEKLAFRLDAIDARMESLDSRLGTARAELERGLALMERGVITTQRLEQLQTAVDVIQGEIRSLESEAQVVEQQVSEGEVLSPQTGVVLSVPVSRGSVITPGEVVAEIGGGGVFLRLRVPERHAGNLSEGDEIMIGSEASGESRTGRLVKLYPQIEGGRVQADVEVEGLTDRFVGRRVLVRLPVGVRSAILVPQAALSRQNGLDFVVVEMPDGEQVRRTVVPGETIERDDTVWREILTGLAAGQRVVVDDE